MSTAIEQIEDLLGIALEWEEDCFYKIRSLLPEKKMAVVSHILRAKRGRYHFSLTRNTSGQYTWKIMEPDLNHPGYQFKKLVAIGEGYNTVIEAQKDLEIYARANGY